MACASLRCTSGNFCAALVGLNGLAAVFIGEEGRNILEAQFLIMRLCALVLTMLPFFVPSICRSAEIPESVHREYLVGATMVHLATDPTEIPLSGTDWSGHYRSPYVQVYVNGHGPFTFLFDTGSNVTTLSSRVAKAARVKIINHVPGHHAIALASEIRVGAIRMDKYYTVIANGDDVDGIFGFNSFGKNYLTFDFLTKTLQVSSRPALLPSAFWLAYTLREHLPMIDLFANRRRLPTLIDTGDDAYAWEATSSDLRGLLFDHSPTQAAIVFNGQTGATETSITSIDGSLRLGPMSSRRPAVAINESLPLPDIGMSVIDQFVMEFDRIHHRVGFLPLNSLTEFSVPGEITTGFYISFRQPIRRIRDVIPGLAPGRVGMNRGDTVLTIDGRDASRVSFEAWDRLLRARRPIVISWQHDRHTFSNRFPVLELR
jgi:hypothetical protein